MRSFSRHKVMTAVSAVVVIAILCGAIYVVRLNNALSGAFKKADYLPDRVPLSTAATKPTKTPNTTDPETDDITDLSLESEVSQQLLDADALIRLNLDDSKIWRSDKVFNVVLFGYDYGSKNYPYGRSDAMLVVSINRTAKKLRLISLSRAAYVAIPGYANTRLSHAHGYGGPDLAIRTIENNYKFRVDNFAGCSFESFQKIIDAFGGVKLTLTAKEAKVLRAHFDGFAGAGTYKLNGEQALLYARTRKIDTDRDRTGRQRKVLFALLKKVQRMTPTRITELLDEILPYVQTDFSEQALRAQMAQLPQYLGYERSQYIVPAKATRLVLRDDFEVMLLDWPYEIDTLHELMYEDVIPEYEEKR
ncbi:MAG: LCP family protein [Clostridia bacterium]|nr:LCP family protein [Clostridia bacterium]